MRKPKVIGILSMKEPAPVLPNYAVTSHYIEQVREAGGLPLQLPIPAGASEAELQIYIDLCDGFLIPGGPDFDSSWFREHLLPGLSPDEGAQTLEWQGTALRFLRLAAASGKRMLGICLGQQIINIALGGSLYQDIPTQFPSEINHRFPMTCEEDRWRIGHTVRICGSSMLHEIIGACEIAVNSFHHQAVKALASGFRATAWSEEGLIEAMESDDHRILGVQWHPENLAQNGDSYSKSLFRWICS